MVINCSSNEWHCGTHIWDAVSRITLWFSIFKSPNRIIFGAYLGGLFYDLYGSYDYAWYLAIALSVFAGLIHLPIKEKAIERTQAA